MPRVTTKNKNPLQQSNTGGYYVHHKRVCILCRRGIVEIDHKDVELLKRFISSFGRINSARRNRICAKHQRIISHSIKRARHLALLPFVG